MRRQGALSVDQGDLRSKRAADPTIRHCRSGSGRGRAGIKKLAAKDKGKHASCKILCEMEEYRRKNAAAAPARPASHQPEAHYNENRVRRELRMCPPE